ncbi:transporter [Pokkaliibacter plantistimulans]|uniref:Transporter n=1 Tax=Pokkaliibacter plantistimulans TaxID=1635171 RepID=A0ABX5LU41_9GAMM|nr:C4-dicarboxylic acid transporter DauA [Pokkaliibacter plantistimulans]PXF29851.1 transporter [Pokkaliibacter plantistimulans]
MPHRAHLFSLRIGHALRESCLNETYNLQRLSKDLLAGITVGIIAIPLSMALAIASGVAPQYGLYTAIIAGFLIALTGGSRYSISGPTAAFVVILYPVAQQFGLGGLLLASLLSGLILILLALLRLGRLIEYIPEAVTLGFTGGIAVSIATLQIKDFFGLSVGQLPERYLPKVEALLLALPGSHWPSVLVAGLTLAIMLLWPKLKTPVPAHLPAVLAGSLLALALNHLGWQVDTIGSRFSYVLADGSQGQGIPPVLPELAWPWSHPGADGKPLAWSWAMVQALLPSAFAIAMLGAIESLLCAVVLDGMTGKRHSANSELLGQGIGNVITPFFGGITATAAIARSAANFRAGAQSPLAAMIHALVVLLALLSLSPLLAYLPMPAMAALLLMVAWNMSEAPKAVHLLKTAPRGDVLVFLTCLLLTILFDMVIAITAGILLAAVLFMQEMAAMTQVTDITDGKRVRDAQLPAGWRVFKINGPLFFAAAERIFGELAQLHRQQQRSGEPLPGMILYLDGVTVLDAGGLSALLKLMDQCRHAGVSLWLADMQQQPLRTLRHAGVRPEPGVTAWFPTLQAALERAAAPSDQA